MTSKSWPLLAILVASAVALAGCAGGADESSGDTEFGDGGNYPDEQTIIVEDNATDDSAAAAANETAPGTGDA